MEVFDSVRRKWVRLTPEEWVRQNVLEWMTGIKAYPASLIAVEKEVRLGPLTKKFDILVYDNSHNPWLMVECKSMDVPVTEKVLMQVLRYRMSVPAGVLVVTNGIETHALALEKVVLTQVLTQARQVVELQEQGRVLVPLLVAHQLPLFEDCRWLTE